MLKARTSARTGVKSLYLEMNRDGRRTYEFLHLYLNPGRENAAMNKVTMEAAKTIQARRIVEIQRGEAEILSPRGKSMLMTEYFEEYLRGHAQMSASHRKGMMITFRRWVDFAGKNVRLKDVTPRMLVGYSEYLRGDLLRYCSDKSARIVNLRPNSVRMHYDRIVWVLNSAHKEGLIPVNPADRVDATAKPRTEATERGYLTDGDLRKLVRTPCPNPELKRAFLFACYTGLRKSDVYSLSWENIHGNTISLRMQKTKDPITIPLSDAAMKYLGRREEHDPPFVSNSERQMYRDLGAWARAAGVTKHVTFHVSRHTFATMALTYGADIYTVGKLLGHKNLKTTQIYAQIVDKKKEAAVNLLPDFSED